MIVANEFLIIWVDSKIEDEENKQSLYFLTKNLQEKISCFSSIKEASKYVQENQHSFILSVVSGRLANDFLQANETYDNIVRVIVYCFIKEKYSDLPT